MMRSLMVALTAAVVLTACSSNDGRSLAPARDPLPATTTTRALAPLPGAALRATASWNLDGAIPDRYACPTTVATPALDWSGVPDGTVELAVVFSTDGVADQVLAGIDPAASGLTEAGRPDGSFWWPPTDVDARWQGVCGADADADYQFTVYALNQQLEAADDTAVSDLVGLLALTAIGQATVTGQLDVPPPT